MKTLALFGNHPVLSLAELTAAGLVNSANIKEINKFGIVFEYPHSPDNIDQLGSITRFAEVILQIPGLEISPDELSTKIAALLHDLSPQKITFGISQPGPADSSNKILANDIKSCLRQKGNTNVRFVLPSDSDVLNSAQVINNGLIRAHDKFEILLLQGAKTLDIALTKSIQDIDSYTARDINRPYRARYEGMMPIKLAQTLINLAVTTSPQTGMELLLDPFCGSGTILQEALHKGLHVLGTDINGQSIQRSQANLSWFLELQKKSKKRTGQQLPDYQLLPLDVRKLSQGIAPDSIDWIVSEGYLGRLFNKQPNEPEINLEIRSAAQLYVQAFEQMYRVLKSRAKIAITLPYYLRSHISCWQYILDDIYKIGYNQLAFVPKGVAGEISKLAINQITDLGTYIYSRPQQIVGREILLLQKR